MDEVDGNSFRPVNYSPHGSTLSGGALAVVGSAVSASAEFNAGLGAGVAFSDWSYNSWGDYYARIFLLFREGNWWVQLGSESLLLPNTRFGLGVSVGSLLN